MLFHSTKFFFFFLAFYFIYILIRNHRKLQIILLLLGSYFFYASWNYKYLILILVSTISDFSIGRLLLKTNNIKERKFFLYLSIGINLSILFIFKYFNFFIESASQLLQFMGLNVNLPVLSVLLPIGISFYIFRTMSYIIDVYKRKINPTTNLIEYALYVAFFPQLLAGPIERASDFLPYVKEKMIVSKETLYKGVFLFSTGIFKKIILADFLARLHVDLVFASPSSYSSIDILFAIYGYAFQIYNDFSGYSDIAIGLSLMLGFKTSMNFNYPYLSANIREFWKRWHITLSTWLRDYIYVYLGGTSSKSRFLVYKSILLTMLIGGLWHGASWNFIFWGGYHGLLIVVSHIRAEFLKSKKWLNKNLQYLLEVFLTFHLVCLGWVFFKTSNFIKAIEIFQNLFSFKNLFLNTNISFLYSGILFTAFIMHLFPLFKYKKLKLSFLKLQQYQTWLGVIFNKSHFCFKLFYATMAILISLILAKQFSEFIYLQF